MMLFILLYCLPVPVAGSDQIIEFAPRQLLPHFSEPDGTRNISSNKQYKKIKILLFHCFYVFFQCQILERGCQRGRYFETSRAEIPRKAQTIIKGENLFL